MNSCVLADVGPVRPAVRLRPPVAAPAEEPVRRAIIHDLGDTETLTAVQEQVESLTLGIPDVRIDELPLQLQRHTTGVPRRWTRLLRMIAQTVAYYQEHH